MIFHLLSNNYYVDWLTDCIASKCVSNHLDGEHIQLAFDRLILLQNILDFCVMFDNHSLDDIVRWYSNFGSNNENNEQIQLQVDRND